MHTNSSVSYTHLDVYKRQNIAITFFYCSHNLGIRNLGLNSILSFLSHFWQSRPIKYYKQREYQYCLPPYLDIIIRNSSSSPGLPNNIIYSILSLSLQTAPLLQWLSKRYPLLSPPFALQICGHHVFIRPFSFCKPVYSCIIAYVT